MIIKNNTNSIVEIGYYDVFGSSMKHHLCLRPYGTHQILPKDGIRLLQDELQELIRKNIISVEPGVATSVVVDIPAEQHPEEMTEFPPVEQSESTDNVTDDNESVQETADVVSEDTEPVPESTESSFVCEVCGKEFASSRGLNKHMKSHES